jgi:hypothetical protein
MSTAKRREPPIVPIEYAGLWIAWDKERSTIVASGKTFAEVRRAAQRAGETEPLFDKVPPVDVRFVGRYQ